MPHDTLDRPHSSEFLRSLAQGAAIGAIILAVAIPWIRSHRPPPVEVPAPPQVTAPPAPVPVPHATVPGPQAPAHGPLADFHGVRVPPDVREVANWAFYTRDNHGHSVVILDKRGAMLHVFDPTGRLVASSPVLLGLAIGDDAEPGLGDKPLSQVRDDEKTTPAGRFVAEPGENTQGEDIIWFDYDEALAMHRVVKGTPQERRAQRLASPDPRQRRISFGCVNLRPAFYDHVLSPTVKKTGAIVYVLPEVKSLQVALGAWDVTDPAARPPASTAPGVVTASAAGRPPRQYREAPSLTPDPAAAR